jgi:methionyl-tRNA formyltransferase
MEVKLIDAVLIDAVLLDALLLDLGNVLVRWHPYLPHWGRRAGTSRPTMQQSGCSKASSSPAGRGSRSPSRRSSKGWSTASVSSRRAQFTDDASRNVDAAIGPGFRTHLFRDHADLGDRLRTLGVRLRTLGDHLRTLGDHLPRGQRARPTPGPHRPGAGTRPPRIEPMRLLFAGTPAVALPALETLLSSDHEVAAVLTRPDAPSGRGRHLEPSPVRQRAEAAAVPVLTPATVRGPEILDALRELAVDCAAVVAYGALLPAELLAVPRHGWVNLHFSLLPAWRGAAPVQHAVLHGDEITGATTFRITEGLDDGPVFGTLTEAIGPRDTSGDLLGRLAVAGAGLLLATLDGIADGSLVPVPQPAEGVSRAPRLTVDDGRIRWEHPAAAVDRRARACTPAPGAWTTTPDGARLKLGPVLPRPAIVDLAPAEIRVTRDDVLVGTGTHAVQLGGVAPAGRRMMPAADWGRGARLGDGARLGGEPR